MMMSNESENTFLDQQTYMKLDFKHHQAVIHSNLEYVMKICYKQVLQLSTENSSQQQTESGYPMHPK